MNTPIKEHRIVISHAADFGRVAVMFGGISTEREVSLDTGNAVLEALRSRGVDALVWDPAERSMHDFDEAGFDRVWIALHGTGGEDGALQGSLRWLNTPYTGSGVMASAVAMDNLNTRHSSAKNNAISNNEPSRPNSSANTANTKSVCASGR